MFVLLSVAAGAALGCGVCAFGMWAFLKGQSAAILVKWGALPGDISTGRKKETGGDTSPGMASPSIAEQLGAMFKTERGE